MRARSADFGEVEWYAAVGCAATALYLKSVFDFLFGTDLEIVINVDSSTAKAIGARQGLGKVRHLGTGHFANKSVQAS